jgi:hypothetical protein
MLAVFVGMMSTDTLCPEHRAWVAGLASVGAVSIVTSVVALLRGWPSAAVLALLSALLGVAIGLIDAAHSGTRGPVIAAAFGILSLGAIFLAENQLRIARWDRRTLRPLDDDQGDGGGLDVTATEPGHEAESPRALPSPDVIEASTPDN